MKNWMMIVIMMALLSGTVIGQASPASGYDEFLKSLDSISTKSVIPVVDDQFTAAPSVFSSRVVGVAKAYLGIPVVWGGASPAQGFDCSGLVQYVFRQVGVELPRTADLQFLVGATVSKAALRPGDLVYFTTYAPGASHVGIYIGSDKFIHTSSSAGVVAIGNMSDTYFVQRFYGAKRVSQN